MYISHEELRTYQPSAGSLENPYHQLARQAKKAVCTLWNSYPNKWLSELTPFSVPRWYFNTICSAPPDPDPPLYPTPPPFSGGQCNIAYYVSCSYANANTWQGQPCNQIRTATTTSRQLNQILGPITSVGFSFNTNFNATLLQATSLTPQGITYQVPLGASGTGNLVYPLPNCQDKGGSNPAWAISNSIQNIIITPVSGTDNCGSLPPAYPDPTPPVTPQPYVFNLYDGDEYYDYNFTWQPTFEYPIVFEGDTFNIIVDFGGTTFDWNGDLILPNGDKDPVPTLPPPSLPPQDAPPGGGGKNPRPRSPGVQRKTPYLIPQDQAEEKLEEEGEQILWIKIVVSGIYDNSKFIIEFQNDEDDILFAGYLSWIVQDNQSFSVAPEIPIRRRKTIIKKPPEMEGYRIRSQNGAIIEVTEFTQKVL